VYDGTYGVVPTHVDEQDEEAADKFARQIAKRDAMLEVWFTNLKNERQDMKGISGTAWAAYNAVSEFHDHQSGRFLPVKESDGRVHSNLFGTANARKLVAFKKALATVS
jgi:hypothetical protein